MFISWKDSSDTFNEDRRYCTRDGTQPKGKKSFSSPYLKHDGKNSVFYLVLPPQIVRFGEQEGLHWNININGNIHRIEINPYTQGVIGYKTEEEKLSIYSKDIFSEIVIELENNVKKLRRFKIVGERIRFFDNDGYFIKAESLIPCEAYSITPSDFIPISDAIMDSEPDGHLMFTYYNFINGDVILLPDGKSLLVGRKLREGLSLRGQVNGASAQWDGENIPIYRVPPSVLIKLYPQRSSGTAIHINHFKFRMSEAQNLCTVDLHDQSGECGYLFNLKDYNCTQDGLYEVNIDVPGDRTNRIWRFALIKELSYQFEEAPYIFKSRGTICLPMHLTFIPLSENIKKDVDNLFKFDITAGISQLFFTCAGIQIGFDLPVLSYKFGDGTWQIAQHCDIWHEHFEPKLYIKYHTEELKVMLDEDTDNYGKEQIESFTKIKSKDVFECDLNRFRSWFGKTSARRQLLIKLLDVPEPVPLLGIITKSIFHSGILKFEHDKLNGEIDIDGQAAYFVDLFCNGRLLAQKLPLTDKKFSVNGNFDSGKYEVIVFESETDDSGFGDVACFEIGRKSLELINPENLRGKNLEIKTIRPEENNRTFLGLSRTYKIVNLTQNNAADNHNYIGTMITTWNKFAMTLDSFDVNVEFYDLDNLQYTYITFCDGNNKSEFLYDENEKIIVKDPKAGLSRTQEYRRYKQSLYPGDYVFVVAFLESEG